MVFLSGVLEVGRGSKRLRAELGNAVARHAPLEEAGAVGTVAGAFLGNPVTYLYDIPLDASGMNVPARAIVEVSFSDG